MKLARVFPRRTRATPDDELAFFGPPRFDMEADEVHVDVTFTADKLYAEHLAEQWKPIRGAVTAFIGSASNHSPQNGGYPCRLTRRPGLSQ